MEEQRINLKPALIASGVIIVLMLMISAWAWVQIPADQKIPVHSNLSGQVDRYGGKVEGLLGLPLTVLFLVGLFTLITRIEPCKMNLQKSMKAYTTIWISSLIVFLAMHIFGVLGALGWKVDTNAVMPVLIGLLFIIIGNYMGKIRRNHFAGTRTPWTLSSDLSWDKTNRLSGKLLILFGIITVLGAFMDNMSLWLGLLMAELIIMLITVMVYSYLVWKADPAIGGTASEPKWMVPTSIILMILLAVAVLISQG